MTFQHYNHIVVSSILFCSVCSTADVKEHLVPVHASSVNFSFPNRLKVSTVYGSGICLQQDCSVVATCYHIQGVAGATLLNVSGGRTAKVMSLARDSDSNKSDIPMGATRSILSYNVANDISFIYTKNAVPTKSGTPYSFDFRVGQKVHVAGYHNHIFTSREALIIGKNVALTIGQTPLNNNLILDTTIVPGQSGSAVFDDSGRLLGMLFSSGQLTIGDGHLSVSIALPTETIARALVNVDPTLGQALFPQLPTTESPSIVPLPLIQQDSDPPADTSPVIPHLSALATALPNAVLGLNTAASLSASRLVNFIAKQCLVIGTQKPICHEVSVIDDEQNFQKIGNHGKLGKRISASSIKKYAGSWKRTSWYEALGEIADNPWIFQGSTDGHYLFTFNSTVSDDRCYYEESTNEVPLFGGRHLPWAGAVACFEMVLTDRHFNIESTFTEMYPPKECAAQLYQSAIYYSWSTLPGLAQPVLLPETERTTTKFAGHDDLVYTNMSWSNYAKFRAEHTIRTGNWRP
jgi:hypothetical protein